MDNGTSPAGLPLMSGPSISPNDSSSLTMPRVTPLMHMSFFAGTEVEFLFPGFPGSCLDMYVFSLFLVFTLAVAVEALTVLRAVNTRANTRRALLCLSVLYAFHVGVAYMLMLAVMSYNVGVFLVAIAGHIVGFMVTRNRAVPGAQPQVNEGPIPIDSAAIKV